MSRTRGDNTTPDVGDIVPRVEPMAEETVQAARLTTAGYAARHDVPPSELCDLLDALGIGMWRAI